MYQRHFETRNRPRLRVQETPAEQRQRRYKWLATKMKISIESVPSVIFEYASTIGNDRDKSLMLVHYYGLSGQTCKEFGDIMNILDIPASSVGSLRDQVKREIVKFFFD